MAIRVVEFLSRGTKLERFLPKNQHTERKLLNFEDQAKLYIPSALNNSNETHNFMCLGRTS